MEARTIRRKLEVKFTRAIDEGDVSRNKKKVRIVVHKYDACPATNVSFVLSPIKSH
jgi:ArsR family metal-binding transcriptional regulator